MQELISSDTICALSTAPGIGAIAVIRLSGADSFAILKDVFSKPLEQQAGHTVVYGFIQDGERQIDDVVLTVFRSPNSYTGEDTVEISCHGSVYIQRQILELLVQKGARMAKPGEYTMRAFMNGKMDLSQAEAVADLIASESRTAHEMAIHQMRGGFSNEINFLRDRLIHFASMIELELDFSEEDVEFADRLQLKDLVNEIQVVVRRLIDSFATGNVVKNGVPVAILGAPNMGKSTLLNALLNDDRAIVSEIAGTTRDTIEDAVNIEGIRFRFIDTAGIRETEDTIETLGIERAWEKARGASVVVYLVDASETSEQEISDIKEYFQEQMGEGRRLLLIAGNKSDKGVSTEATDINLSAKTREGIDELTSRLVGFVNEGLAGSNTVVTNLRHFEALSNTLTSLNDVQKGLENQITGDFLAIDIRRALYHLGEITGQITTDDLLDNIFSKFCIGK
jgi:tRNA modification GTPase